MLSPKETMGLLIQKSWEDLHRQVGGEIGKIAIMDHIKSLDGFTYKTTNSVPHMTTTHKERVVNWAKEFWLFWHSAKRLGLRIMLLHIDEKVSYSIY